MTEKYTIKDTTRDLTFLMTLTKAMSTDEQGFWFDWVDDKRFVYDFEKEGEGKQIVLFQDPLPKGDYYFFNPFAEGFGKKSPATQLFYQMIRAALNVNIRQVMLYVAREVLLSKEEKDKSLSPSILRMTSVPVDKKSSVFDVIDEKMLEEFEKIHERVNGELVFVAYLKNQMTARVKIDALVDKQWDDKFTDGIRKKSVAAFKALLMGVLGIKTPEDVEEFTVKYDPDLKSAAKLHTIISVYLKLYTRFNDTIDEAYTASGAKEGINEIDLGQLQEVIDRLPLAYAIAKHMVQPSYPKTQVNDTTTADTSKLTIAGHQRRFPGPEIIDDFGRKTRASQAVSFGRTEKPRFAPHVISDIPVDPFAPATRTNTAPTPFAGGFNSGGGFGNSGFGNTSFGNQGGYFDNQQQGFGGGFNNSLPSNFGTPAVRKTYF